MRETIELRVNEDFACLLFAPEEGKRMGTSVRCVRIDSADNRLKRIGELQVELTQRGGRPFFYGWDIRRTYSKPEIDAASLFSVRWERLFEPAAEECGTVVDDVCPQCGAGTVRKGGLRLPIRKIPKNSDFSMTIAGERVVSGRGKEVFEECELAGARFAPITNVGSRGAQENWWELGVEATADILPPTSAGLNPFDLDLAGQHRSPCGHVIGLNLLSEVTVAASSLGRADIVESRQYIGVRRGLLRPQRVLLVRPRVLRAVLNGKLRGWTFEVAYTA